MSPNQNDYFIFVKSNNHKRKFIKNIDKILSLSNPTSTPTGHQLLTENEMPY